MTDQGQERRRFHRIPFDTSARIIGSEHQWQSKLLDVSLNGALIEKPADWDGHAGDHYTLEIILGDHSDLIIRMDVVVVAHIELDAIGFRCEYIDVDSVAHLRRLLELNLGDADLVNRDLSALTR